MIFNTNATEQMRIMANGQIGVGTSSPSAMMDVAGDFGAMGNYRLDGDTLIKAPGYSNLIIGHNAGGGVGVDSSDENNRNVFIGHYAGMKNITGESNVFIGDSAGINSLSLIHI